MCPSFETLFREPDIPASIFFLLSEKDLCQAESVCTQWRRIIIDERVWRKKLEKYFDNNTEWNIVLKQNDWLPGVVLGHEEHKSLLFKIQSFIGPSQMTNNILRYITDDLNLWNNCNCKSNNWQQQATSSVPEQHLCFLAYRVDANVTWEEKLFLRRRHHDHVAITSKIPPHSRALRAATRRKIFSNDGSRPRVTNFDNTGQCYSNLILVSPTAFPILVASVGNVAVAGARYGKGKLVVVAHESILCHKGLMQGAVEWCSGTTDSPVFKDPLSKSVCHRDPFPVKYVGRGEVTGDMSVYITNGHYEDHVDHLMEYVKHGGGLIIGGHAWSWALNDPGIQNGEKCSMLDHPGNKIIARAGIVFSREVIRQNDIWFQVDNMPALKHSLYYALRACKSRHLGVSICREEIFEKLLKGTEYEDIQLFSDRLRHNEYFKLVLQYMHDVQK